MVHRHNSGSAVRVFINFGQWEGPVGTSLLDQYQPQWYLQDPDEAQKVLLPFVWLLLERKRWSPINYLVWCFWSRLIWVSVKILMTFFGFDKIKMPDPASGDLWWHQHGHISCFNPWKIGEKKLFNLVSHFAL